MERIVLNPELDVPFVFSVFGLEYYNPDDGILFKLPTTYKTSEDSYADNDFVYVYTIENSGKVCLKFVDPATESVIYLLLENQNREDIQFGYEVLDTDKLINIYVNAFDIIAHSEDQKN